MTEFISPSLLRTIDANMNRAREGLRVLEEVARFYLDDAFLTELAKDLRHQLEEAFTEVPPSLRIVARNTLGDVGTNLTTASEAQRIYLVDVITANAARVAEALRCLEEFGKLVSPRLGGQAKSLRYRLYTLEKALAVNLRALERLRDVRLYVLVDPQDSEAAFERLVSQLVEAGVHALQLRAKDVSDRVFLNRAKLLRQLTVQTGTLCIINDRPDIAALVDADGVHLGQDDLPVALARNIVGPHMLIGVSTHSIGQAEEAVLAGADYIGVGPVFPSQTKSFADFPGLELVRGVTGRITLPAFAIGGIHRENLRQVLEAGARRVAVSAAIVKAADPFAEARFFLEELKLHPLTPPDSTEVHSR
jgi:thiamine-phosphate pyrophosphorylase